MPDQILKKIIKTGVGSSRSVMAAVGLAIALFLIFIAVQLQANYNQLLYGSNNRDSIANFLVVSKQIDGNSTSNTIDPQQIAALKAQPFVDAVGELTASRFKVSAESPSTTIPFYTDLFFESVPDSFIDVNSADWQWEEGSGTIPLIIPNQFLDLYNFGFAPSQNLIQLTQQMVMALPVVINIYHMGVPVRYTGRIIGFSDRIASVLVPQNFLTWANEKYGSRQPSNTSRVVIKTSDPGNPQLVQYLQDNGLQTDADKTRFSKYRQIVNTVVGASWITGAVMLLFALLVFSLFIQLTIASTKSEIGLLITLGVSPRQLQRFLIRQFFPLNAAIAVGCLLLVAVLQYVLYRLLQDQQMYIRPLLSLYTIGAGGAIIIVLWLVNQLTIRKYIDAGRG